GQTDKRAQFLARSSGYNAFLTGGASATFAFRGAENKIDYLSMKLPGVNDAVQARAESPTGGHSNYYIGNDRSKWLENVPNYYKVRSSNMYPGIDVVFQGNDRNLRYDFDAKPGSDPRAIRMAYEGARRVSLDKQGNLVLAMAAGQLVNSKPYVY